MIGDMSSSFSGIEMTVRGDGAMPDNQLGFQRNHDVKYIGALRVGRLAFFPQPVVSFFWMGDF